MLATALTLALAGCGSGREEADGETKTDGPAVSLPSAPSTSATPRSPGGPGPTDAPGGSTWSSGTSGPPGSSGGHGGTWTPEGRRTHTHWTPPSGGGDTAGQSRPSKDLAWTPFGPTSPSNDYANFDHVYDLVQRRDCQLAQTRYQDAGRQGKWESDPYPWKVLKGLVAACHIAQGHSDQWQTVTSAYSEVKGHSSGSCKYDAGFRVLEELAVFRMQHPDGKVVFGPPRSGRAACPNEITEFSSSTVRQGGYFGINGTWPVPVSVYFDEVKASFQPGDPKDRCCHRAGLSVEVPDGLPLGEAHVTLRGEGNSFYLAGPTVTVLPSVEQP
ncbi:hypothetical protein ACHBTE_15710 [Streptomyces sp. M41]|uniref:hypothetical protein n=1 Tax=Streptomyces sp. M41 TaxID=3059412 RepID=UPI00374CAF9A